MPIQTREIVLKKLLPNSNTLKPTLPEGIESALITFLKNGTATGNYIDLIEDENVICTFILVKKDDRYTVEIYVKYDDVNPTTQCPWGESLGKVILANDTLIVVKNESPLLVKEYYDAIEEENPNNKKEAVFVAKKNQIAQTEKSLVESMGTLHTKRNPTLAIPFDNATTFLMLHYFSSDLENLLSQPEKIVEKTHIALAIINHLAELHRKGYVHQHLTLGRIALDWNEHDNQRLFVSLLMDPDYVAKLDENGLATYIDVRHNPIYLAPEISQGQLYGIDSEIYSYGILLLILFFGTLEKDKRIAHPQSTEAIKNITLSTAPIVQAIIKHIIKNTCIVERECRMSMTMIQAIFTALDNHFKGTVGLTTLKTLLTISETLQKLKISLFIFSFKLAQQVPSIQPSICSANESSLSNSREMLATLTPENLGLTSSSSGIESQQSTLALSTDSEMNADEEYISLQQRLQFFTTKLSKPEAFASLEKCIAPTFITEIQALALTHQDNSERFKLLIDSTNTISTAISEINSVYMPTMRMATFKERGAIPASLDKIVAALSAIETIDTPAVAVSPLPAPIEHQPPPLSVNAVAADFESTGPQAPLATRTMLQTATFEKFLLKISGIITGISTSSVACGLIGAGVGGLLGGLVGAVVGYFLGSMIGVIIGGNGLGYLSCKYGFFDINASNKNAITPNVNYACRLIPPTA